MCGLDRECPRLALAAVTALADENRLQFRTAHPAPVAAESFSDVTERRLGAEDLAAAGAASR